MEISNAFECDSGMLVRAYAYFMKMARDDLSVLATVAKSDRRQSGAGDGDSYPDSETKITAYGRFDEDSDYSEGGSCEKRRKGQSDSSSGGNKPKRTRTQDDASLTSRMAPHTDPDCELDMACCHYLTNIGEGRSGLVISCVYQGKDIAVKLVDRNKGNIEALEAEKQIYVELAPFQGRCVPAVVSYNVVSRGRTMVGFAMEKLDPLPDDFALWSKSQREGAVAVLIELAEVGIFHSDIRGANFGLRGSVVVVFDFECVSRACVEAKRYPRQFRRSLNAISQY